MYDGREEWAIDADKKVTKKIKLCIPTIGEMNIP